MLGPVQGETQDGYSRNSAQTGTLEPLAQHYYRLPGTGPGSRLSAGARQSCLISNLTHKGTAVHSSHLLPSNLYQLKSLSLTGNSSSSATAWTGA